MRLGMQSDSIYWQRGTLSEEKKILCLHWFSKQKKITWDSLSNGRFLLYYMIIMDICNAPCLSLSDTPSAGGPSSTFHLKGMFQYMYAFARLYHNIKLIQYKIMNTKVFSVHVWIWHMKPPSSVKLVLCSRGTGLTQKIITCFTFIDGFLA